MLDGRGENVPPAAFETVVYEAQQGQVVALRGPAGESHFLRPHGQNGRDLLAGRIDRLLCPLSVDVAAAAGVAEIFEEVGRHGLEDAYFLRLGSAENLRGSRASSGAMTPYFLEDFGNAGSRNFERK